MSFTKSAAFVLVSFTILSACHNHPEHPRHEESTGDEMRDKAKKAGNDIDEKVDEAKHDTDEKIDEAKH